MLPLKIEVAPSVKLGKHGDKEASLRGVLHIKKETDHTIKIVVTRQHAHYLINNNNNIIYKYIYKTKTYKNSILQFSGFFCFISKVNQWQHW